MSKFIFNNVKRCLKSWIDISVKFIYLSVTYKNVLWYWSQVANCLKNIFSKGELKVSESFKTILTTDIPFIAQN